MKIPSRMSSVVDLDLANRFSGQAESPEESPGETSWANDPDANDGLAEMESVYPGDEMDDQV